MSQTPKENNLFIDFPPVSKAEWEKKILEDLNTGSYQDKLAWKTMEGFTAPPFSHRTDLESLNTDELNISVRPGWRICQHIHEVEPGLANKSIQKAIENGTDTVSFLCRATPNVGLLGGDMTGLQVQAMQDFKTLIDGVQLNKTGLFFDSGMTTPALVAMLKESGQKPGSAFFTFDPFTYTAAHGRLPVPEPEIKQLIRQLIGNGLWKTLCADALFYRNSGATLVQEVGIALALASEFIAVVPEKDRQKTVDSLFVRLSAGSLYFPEIAKFRAIRMLWKTLLEAYGLQTYSALELHAETSRFNKTVSDSYNNILRLTTEAMAASAGGADTLLVHPYDEQFKTPGQFSRRISRNIQHILNEEAYFSNVADPAAGSYYIEQLTDTIAEESWSYFQFIEKQGGVLEALKGNFIQESIESSKQEKLKAYNEQKKVLVGTNHYTNPDEELPGSLQKSEFTNSLQVTEGTFNIDKNNLSHSLQKAFQNGATVGDVAESFLNPQKVLYPSLIEFNAGMVFDSIRLKTKEFSQKDGKKPLAVTVPVGDKKWRNARANFAKNFLGCAGFNVASSPGFDSLREAEDQIKNNAHIYILCSSDKEYDDLVEPFCKTFGTRGNLLIIAGNPGEFESKYRKAGIDYFIHRNSDIAGTLQSIQEQLFQPEKTS